MKYRILVILIITFLSHYLCAQETIQEALTLIEKNNTTLTALRLDTDAEKLSNRTGIFPSNPEAGFNYLWGSPDIINNRTDFSITQSFDFPSAYAKRGSIARIKNEQAELVYEIRKREILSEAWQLCAEVIYRNALAELLEQRRSHAEELAGIWQRRLETGDANILEANRAQINLITISRKQELNEVERQTLLASLASMNGGREIILDITEFPAITIDTDFDRWYSSAEAANPQIQWLSMESSVTDKQESLSKALWLPQFSAGYMSEELPGESFRGVTLGMSIPLWQNRNTVKSTKAKGIATEQYELAGKLQFRNQMQAAYSRVMTLRKDAEEFRAMLQPLANTTLLEKALNSGQISISEYLLELAYYYDAYDQLLEMEYSLYKAYGELYPYIKL